MNYERTAKLGTIMNRLYRRFAVPVRHDEVLFVSRQYDEPSEDFRLLAQEFERAGWKTTTICQTEKGGLAAYAGATLKQLQALGRCRVCVTDGYNPVISAIDFPADNCESEPHSAQEEPWVRYTRFPTCPLVVQLWHGFGAYKKFGWQAVGSAEGRTLHEAQAVHMHRNYSWIVGSGEHNRVAFAQAFGYPTARVVALGRPSIDALRSLRESETAAAEQRTRAGERLRILFAPTKRSASAGQPHPFDELYRESGALACELGVEAAWSWHPVDGREHIGNSGIDSLRGCDVVVTDYSSIVYEAAALGKRVLLYVPDLESYAQSPGLNFDPLAVAPGICCTTHDQLLEALVGLADGTAAYDEDALHALVGDTFEANTSGSVAHAIYEFIQGKLTG